MTRKGVPPGFVTADYLVSLAIKSGATIERLARLFEDEWSGERVTDLLWEVSNDLSPQLMEEAILPFLEGADRVIFYYVSDTKRIFRVCLG